MLDSVLQQCVDGEPQALRVGERDGRLQRAKLPAAVGGRPPAQQHVGDEVVEFYRFRAQKVRVGRCGDEQQPVAEGPQPVQLADDHVDVTLVLLTRDAAGQQLGVPKGDA